MPVPLKVTLKQKRWGFQRADFPVKPTTDALGNPFDFILTPGQASGVGQAEALLALTPTRRQGCALGDKGYDSGAFMQAIEARGMQAVIPPRCNRLDLHECDWFV